MAAPEGRIPHEEGRHVRRKADARPGHRHDQVVDLQGNVSQDDDRTECDGTQQGEEDVPQNLQLRRAIYPSRFAQLVGDAAQAGQVHGHRVAGHLPGSGQHQRHDAGRHADGRRGQHPQPNLLQHPTHERIRRNVPDDRVGEPAPFEKSQPQFVEEEVYAGAPKFGTAWIQEPAPDNARDDERDSHREQVNTAEDPLTPNPPVEQNGQQEADDQTGD